jgi:hypothetical protein
MKEPGIARLRPLTNPVILAGFVCFRVCSGGVQDLPMYSGEQ